VAEAAAVVAMGSARGSNVGCPCIALLQIHRITANHRLMEWPGWSVTPSRKTGGSSRPVGQPVEARHLPSLIVVVKGKSDG
jgi:hypothetical protein